MTAYDALKANIDDLFDEAKLWMDGEPVTTQEQADALNTLESRIRDAAKAAEAQRKIEAKPFDDGKAEVQARYNPLIQKKTGKTDRAIICIKAALKPYLIELDRIQREQADKARAEAEEKQRIAMEAMQQRDAANLEQSIEAERLVEEAKAAEAAASRAGKQKAHAKGEGRATALRTVWRAHMTDKREAAKWAMNTYTDEFLAFIQDKADKAVRAGARSIPGFNVSEEKVL
jgi:hypothetical protein